MATTAGLPLQKTLAPASIGEVAEMVRLAGKQGTALYPIGGQTAQQLGLTPRREGWGLSMTQLNRVVDYPARDMTITVEAGITLDALAKTLATERQRLPIDVPFPERATLGGVVATNASGPRRYGCGTIRDYVIGISAVDGRGVAFKGGGRVVKNVAGYDFCKLLTGSFGTLAVITQVTLKVKPIPEASAFLAIDLPQSSDPAHDTVEPYLAALVNSAVTPTAIELLTGPAWRDDSALGPIPSETSTRLLVGLEGTKVEVDWMLDTLAREWEGHAGWIAAGRPRPRRVAEGETTGLWQRLTRFAVEGESPLVIEAGLPPSRVVPFVREIRVIDPQASIQSHAGDGVVIVRFANFTADDISKVLVGQLQSLAGQAGGHVVVLRKGIEGAWTRRAVWDIPGAALAAMQAVKSQFDPLGILNPDRFVYA